MLMHNPPHPGEIIRELCLEPLGISVTDAAEALWRYSKNLECHTERSWESAPKWPFGFPLLLRPRQRAGSINSLSMSCGMPNSVEVRFG